MVQRTLAVETCASDAVAHRMPVLDARPGVVVDDAPGTGHSGRVVISDQLLEPARLRNRVIVYECDDLSAGDLDPDVTRAGQVDLRAAQVADRVAVLRDGAFGRVVECLDRRRRSLRSLDGAGNGAPLVCAAGSRCD